MTEKRSRYKTKRRQAATVSEHSHQANVITWALLQEGKYPELALLFAVPNGARVSIGQAVKLKQEGMKAGVPDLVLPVARQGYHGLFIEMKKPTGDVRTEQEQWLNALSNQGYLATVCYSDQDAMDTIVSYLDMPEYERPNWF